MLISGGILFLTDHKNSANYRHIYGLFYVHMTMHRNELLFNETNRRTAIPS